MGSEALFPAWSARFPRTFWLLLLNRRRTLGCLRQDPDHVEILALRRLSFRLQLLYVLTEIGEVRATHVKGAEYHVADMVHLLYVIAHAIQSFNLVDHFMATTHDLRQPLYLVHVDLCEALALVQYLSDIFMHFILISACPKA